MTRRVLGVLAGILMITAIAPPTAHAVEWVPEPAPLTTPWTDQVSPTNALPEYPRPQLVRAEWQNLNGVWEFAGAPNLNSPPFGQTLAEGVLVPYPIESALSGIKRHEDYMFYRRTVHRAVHLERSAGQAQLRRRDLGDQGLGQRHAGRHAHRRLRRVLVRHHARAPQRAATRSSSASHSPVDGSRFPIGKQRRNPERHLVHRRVRHLADRVAGTGAARAHHPARHHPGRPRGRARPRRAGHRRADRRRRGAAPAVRSSAPRPARSARTCASRCRTRACGRRTTRSSTTCA